jgi:hypothetical protein
MDYSATEAAQLAPFSHGSLGRALTLNAEQYVTVRDKVITALEAALLPKSYYQLLDSIKSITVERSEMGERLLILEELARDLLVLRASQSGRLIHGEAREKLTKLAACSDSTTLQKFYEDLLEVRESILKVNANVSLALEALLLSLRVTQVSNPR